MKSKRTIEQYCSVCKSTFDMAVVEEADNDEVLWLKCPGCEGFLPYMPEGEEESPDEDKDDEAGDDGEAELAPEDIDQENAIEYDKANEYNVDDIIYHRSWNDYGKVLDKETLPGDRKTIIVHFVNQGKIRLLEGVK